MYGSGIFAQMYMLAFGFVDHPARFMQAFHHYVATRFVFLADFFHTILRAFKRGDACHLNRRESAVIVVALMRPSALTRCGLPTMKPTRQPAML